jgi:hypothetical protein
MTRFATLLVATKGREVKECEKHLKEIRKKTSGIVAIRKLTKPAILSQNRLSVTTRKEPDFMVEIKLDKKTDLNDIKTRLKSMAWDVETIIPY